MAKRPIVGAQQAREKFSDLLDTVAEDNHPVVLRRSTPAMVCVPPAWYKKAAELIGDPWDDWSPPPPKDD
ncbi:type II toxin-antitoxin system prevent-host-death family antitoxin [Micromonospora sp. NPDC053740]|uniref:type II toxin-antitoxin system prevent-host-death family antitoxin n=1 Tax=Micromonospora sp. NPDC053740 TaxID=3155173 RepID=UPI003429C7C3